MDVVEPPCDHIDLDREVGFPLHRARRWITGSFPDVSPERLSTLLLVADALLANAFEHAAGPRRVRLLRPPDRALVRVEVDDASPHLLPVLGRPGAADPRHRGLLLVNRLSSLWGVTPRVDHKTVWAEVVV